MSAWKMPPFVDENGNWFNNCGLNHKQFGSVFWLPSDVWHCLLTISVDCYAIVHQFAQLQDVFVCDFITTFVKWVCFKCIFTNYLGLGNAFKHFNGLVECIDDTISWNGSHIWILRLITWLLN